MKTGSSALVRAPLAVALLCGGTHFAAGSPELAVSPPVNRTAGLAVGGGFGYQYAGLGGQVTYYFPMGGSRLQLAPHLGAGGLSDDVLMFGLAGGLSAVYGEQHRAVLDLGYGLMRAETLDLHLTRVDERAVYGLQGGAGYEYMLARGFLVRAIAGIDFPIRARVGGASAKASFTTSVGIGWKLW